MSANSAASRSSFTVGGSALGPGELAGALDRGGGDVDPNGAPCPRRARGLSGGLPGPAADVEDVIVELDADGRAQYLVVPPQFGIVAAGAPSYARLRRAAPRSFHQGRGGLGAAGSRRPSGMASRRSGREGPVGSPETARNPERMGGQAAMLAAAAQSLLGGAGFEAVRQLMRAARAGLDRSRALQVTRRHNRACYLDS